MMSFRTGTTVLLAVVLTVALSLCGYVPCLAADADIPEVRLALTQELFAAKALLDKNQNQKAWEVLSRIVQEEPLNVDANLLWVQAASRTGRVNQALGALELLVTLHPKDARLRRELANAYATVGDRQSWQSEMEIVRELDSTLYDKDSELAMERAATAARSRWDRFQTAGRLALGLLWDSNTNKGLDNLDVTVGDMKLTMQDGARKKAAFGQYVNGNINGGWRLDDSSPWWIVGDLNIYGKNHYGDVPSNQYFGWGRAALGLRYVATNNMFDFRVRQEHSFYEPEESMNATGLDGSWICAPLHSLQFITRGGVDTRTYMEQDNRDGNYWYAGSYARFLWGRSRANSVMVGGRALGAGTREDRYSYEGWEASLRVSVSPIERLDVTPFVAYREEYYHAPATRLSEVLGEGNRFDRIHTAGVQFTWHWTEHISTELGWQYSKNASNSDFYEFDQHQLNMGMAFSF